MKNRQLFKKKLPLLLAASGLAILLLLILRRRDPPSLPTWTSGLRSFLQKPRHTDWWATERSGTQSAQCSPNKKVIFLKTHKTGGSSIQNILMRFGFSHNLKFVVPHDRIWYFPLNAKFNTSMAKTFAGIGTDQYDMMAFHHVWNLPEISKLVRNAFTFTILRDPVDVFESGYVYLGLNRSYRMDIEGFASHLHVFAQRPNKSIFGKDNLLYDMGLEVDRLEQPALVQQKVEQLDQEFDLVLLAEQMDESLVLLKQRLCWQLADVSYLQQNVRTASSRSNMTEETRAKLKKWLWADYVVYNHFKDKLQQHIFNYGSHQMQLDVQALRSMNRKLFSDCVLESSDNANLDGVFRMAVNTVIGYKVNEALPWCRLFAISEPSFFRLIHDRQEKEFS